ncbi:MAG: hypothetical protein HY401_04045 [Elusimicrobia bacterium]|nr:hypothetical protein [Elusimicrobiota bacterium]
MQRKIETPSLRLKQLRNRFSTKNEAINFDFREFCQKNIGIKRSDVFTHYLHPYPAKLLPYIPAFFLSDEALIDRKAKVLDPFAGSGTVLLEALVNPYFSRPVVGVEINPLARLISRVKTTPLSISRLQKLNSEIVDKTRSISPVKPAIKNIEAWFSTAACNRLGILLGRILELEPGKYRDFFLVCFSRIVRTCSLADPNIPPPVKLKPSKYRENPSHYLEMKEFLEHSRYPDVQALFQKAVSSNCARLQRLVETLDKNDVQVEAQVIWDDAQKIGLGRYSGNGAINKRGAGVLPDKSIGAIITSPPYLTAQKYVRSTKLELFWLGMADNFTLPHLDRMTIGSERTNFKHNMGNRKGDKSDLLEEYTDKMPLLCYALNEIKKLSLDRALEVGQYFLKMRSVLGEMHRVLKDDAYAVIVLGDSKVNGRPFATHKYLAKFAEEVGFRVALVLRDPIRSRGMWIGRHSTGGRIEDEFVLILQR